MPRPKRSSSVLDKADQRAAGLSSIDPKLDLGEGLTLSAFQSKINDTRKRLTEYNTQLSDTDAAQTSLDTGETELADLTERMLKGIASRHGRDSEEYEKAGGTRKSDIRRSSHPANVQPLTKAA